MFQKKEKKKWPVSRFLHTGPKWPLEHDGKVSLFDFLDNKIRNHFFCHSATICKWDKSEFIENCSLEVMNESFYMQMSSYGF